jgi:hypothetical protein
LGRCPLQRGRVRVEEESGEGGVGGVKVLVVLRASDPHHLPRLQVASHVSRSEAEVTLVFAAHIIMTSSLYV